MDSFCTITPTHIYKRLHCTWDTHFILWGGVMLLCHRNTYRSAPMWATSFLYPSPKSEQPRAFFFVNERAGSIYQSLWNSLVFTFPSPSIIRTSEYEYLPKSVVGQGLFCVGLALGKHIFNKIEWLFTTDRCGGLFEKLNYCSWS